MTLRKRMADAVPLKRTEEDVTHWQYRVAEAILALGLVELDDQELPDCRLYSEKMIMEHDCPLIRANFKRVKPQ